MSPPLQALVPSPPIAPVTFRFRVDGRPELAWGVRSFRLDEALSRPYRLVLEVIGEAPEEPLEALLGASCALSLDRGGAPRVIAGILQTIELRGGDEGVVGLALTVVPALALLGERRDRRIWVEASVVEIVDAVVGEHLAALGRSHRWALSGAYPPRERCIQRGESDLALIERLLADEGIHYRFEVDDAGREVVVFADEPAEDAPLELPYIERGAGTAACEALHELRWRRRLTTTASTLQAWSWTRASEPADELVFTDAGVEAEAAGGRRIAETQAPEGAVHGDASRRGLARHQARLLAGCRGHAEADAITLAPGGTFNLAGHPQASCDGVYRVIAVRHRGDAPELQAHAIAEGGPRYRCELDVIPGDMVFRPEVESAGGPAGIETAIVVGPPGEEIHTDEHGRIQVRFHWDRRPAEEATCWLRVAQGWAGAGFGALFIPRVGAEVLVAFLEGDPDRPIVVGSLYNSLNQPPFTLPDKKARSGFRSDTTPGGGGHNELSFDDTRGGERVRLRARRDLVERVGNDHTTTVGRDQTIEVGGIQSVHVGGEQVVHVDHWATLFVADDYTTVVDGGSMSTDVRSGDLRVNVAGDHKLTVHTGKHHTEVLAGPLISRAKEDLLLLSTDGDILAGARGDLRITSNEQKIKLQATKGAIEAIAQKTMTLTAYGLMGLAAKDSLALLADKQAELKAIEGVSIESPTMIVLRCGASTLKLTPQGITLDAPSITSSAVGEHTLSGALIKLN